MLRTKGYVDTDYLQVAAQLVQKTKQRSYDHSHLQAGQAVLDVGCGPATDTLALAQCVGPTGQVVGVDHDSAMIDAANQRARQAGVGAFVQHQQADVAALPFDTGRFDASRSERLFQHLLHPAQALAEMARVVKSGGWVVVVDTDWSSISIDTPEFDIERRIMRVRPERALHNGYAGRQLYRLFKQHNLLDVTVEVIPTVVTHYALARQLLLLDEAEREALAAGIVTLAELQRWHTSLEQADSQGVYFGTGNTILVSGRKN